LRLLSRTRKSGVGAPACLTAVRQDFPIKKNCRKSEADMKVMESIVKSFAISSRNIGLLAVLFVFNVLWNLSPLPFVGSVQDPTKIQLSAPIFILSAIFILLNIFIQAGVFGALKEVIGAEGKAASLGNFAKNGGKFYLRLFCLGLIILAGMALAILIIGIIFSIGAIVKNAMITIVTGVLGIILSLVVMYFLFLLFLSPYVLVIEDAAVIKSMKNSMAFVKKNFMRMAGLSTLLVLIGLGMGFIAGVVSGILSLAVKGLVFQISTSVITGAISAYITVMISTALMLYYSANSKQA
jgi:hypothetical protein